jgi:hypothetical protein
VRSLNLNLARGTPACCEMSRNERELMLADLGLDIDDQADVPTPMHGHYSPTQSSSPSSGGDFDGLEVSPVVFEPELQ